MSKHLSEGELRAALDGELNTQALDHLTLCADCQEQQRRLQTQVEGVRTRLAFLASSANEPVPSAQSALQHFYERKVSQKEIPMLKKIFGSSAIRYASLAVLLLALILAIPATRALADQVLNLFRVQQVTVVPVDFTGLQQLNGNSALGRQISELVSSSVAMTKKPSAPVAAASAADASQKAGFNVRLPQNVTASRINVQNEAAFNFTIDRTKAQALLDEAGRSDLVLPNDIDGAVISVTVPASVRVDYGTCPDPSGAGADTKGTAPRDYPDCVILSEIPSPTVEAPANVDVAQLAQLGLEFGGMNSTQAAAFTKSVDWTSTLVVPIPKNATTNEQVSVDGVTGTLVQRPAGDAAQYVLLWAKNGIIYSIGGLGTNSQQAIDMANSLR
ncbi:MAG TPA: DUF4367 domain-containing protein [Anaerolineales bacterium]